MNEKITMSPYQENIWNLRMAMKGTAVCNIGGYLYSEELTDYKIWQRIMEHVIETCANLRIQSDRFGMLYEKEYTAYKLPYLDRKKKNQSEIIKEMQMWMETPLSDIDAPLYDCKYIRTDQGIYMFGRFSHLIMDGVSFAILMKRQEIAYLSIREKGTTDMKGDSEFLKELQVGIWKEQARDEGYLWYKEKWKDWLPKSYFLGEERTYKANTCKLNLPEDLMESLKGYVKQRGITMESVVFASVAMVLGRYTGEETVVIGRTVLNRTRKQMTQMGMYANTQAVRIEFKHKEMDKFLSDIYKTLFCQLRFSGYSLGDWKKDWKIDGEIFPLVLSYRNHKLLPRMKHALIGELFNGYLEVPLRLNWNEDINETEAELQYSIKGWEEQDATNFLRRVFRALEAFAKAENKNIEEIDVSCKADLFLQDKMKGGQWEYDASVPEMFINSVQERMQEVIIRDEHVKLKGKDVVAECAQIVRMLEKRGNFQKGIVGVIAKRSAHFPVTLMAVMIAGGAFFPLDIREEEERLKRLMTYCEVVISDEDIEEIVSRNKEDNAKEDIRFLRQRIQNITKEKTAYAISTSGTTGHPKIVENSQEGLACRLSWMMDFYGKGGTYLQKTKKTFDVSIWECLLPLIDGGSMYVMPEGREMDCQLMGEILLKERIEKIHFVPSVLNVFLDYAEKSKRTYPYLKMIFSSGERLAPALVKKSQSLLPGVKIYNLYGPAECAIDVSQFLCSDADKEIPIGLPVYGTELYILNHKRQAVPPGGKGEICIVGKQVGKGYLKESASEEEEKRFFGYQGKRAYLTGDIGRYGKDGFLYYLGRKDGQVKVRGIRMNLMEIEKTLTACPEIEEAVVCKRENQLVAFYTSKESVDTKDLCLQMKKELPYYCIPDVFVRMETFPIGKHGKVQRDRLVLPKKTKEMSKETILDKRNPLAAILRPYVQLENLDPKQSVFDMGLTSMAAAEFTLDLQKKGYQINYQEVYRGQTLEGILKIAKKNNHGRKREPLITVWGKERKAKNIVVCFPYAGGGAECFRTFSKGLDGTDVQVWSINLTEYRKYSYQAVAEKVWNGIPRSCRVHVMGYCAGSCAAFAFLEQAKVLRRKVQSVWLCGAFPYQSVQIGKGEYSLWDFLPPVIGKKVLEKIYGKKMIFDQQRYVVFREVVRKAQTYMKQYKGIDRIPTILIYAQQDPLTPMYRRTYARYHKYLKSDFRIYCISGEGHYFMESQGKKIGSLFQTFLERG